MAALKTVLYNLGVVTMFFLIISYPFTSWWGALHTTGKLPTFGELVLLFLGYRILEEFGNYYGHRLVIFLPLLPTYSSFAARSDMSIQCTLALRHGFISYFYHLMS